MAEPHTHGGTDAPECTTCRGRSPSWDDVEVGDTVTFQVTGDLVAWGGSGGTVETSIGTVACWTGDTLKSVEKPVRTFKPGDVVRSRFTDEVVTIGEGRCFVHSSGKWDAHPGIEHDSASYELVEG